MIVYLHFTDSDQDGYCDSEQWIEFLEYKNLTKNQFTTYLHKDSSYEVKSIPNTKHKCIIINMNPDDSELDDYYTMYMNLYK